MSLKARTPADGSPDPYRRRLLLALGAAGASGVFGRAIAALAEEGAAVTPEMIRQAEWISGLEFTIKTSLALRRVDEHHRVVAQRHGAGRGRPKGILA